MDFKRADQNVLWYKFEAECFEEAIPLGNGKIGACVYGRHLDERISLNEETLWTGYPKMQAEDDYPEVYRKVRELLDQEKIMDAKIMLEQNFGGKFLNMYMPLGNLRINFQDDSPLSNYKRELSLCDATHRISYCKDGKNFSRTAFVSAKDRVFVYTFCCDKSSSLSFDITYDTLLKNTIFIEKEALCFKGNAPDAYSDYGKYYSSEENLIYSDDPYKMGVGYFGAVTVETDGGNITFEDCKITVKNADSATLYFAVRTNFESWDKHPADSEIDCKALCFEDIEKAKLKGFDAILADHQKHFSELYGRMGFTLEEEDMSCLPTDQRIHNLNCGKKDNSLYPLLFNFAKYLTISSSQKGCQPSNLQGIWNEKLIPPWQCNYTLNINTQMNYWPTLAFGLKECYEPLIKMVEELSISGRHSAEQFYGFKEGWVSHHNTDLWRGSHPINNKMPGCAQWSQWCMSSGWLVKMLWDYYIFTLDEAFLKKAYPIIEGAAVFYRQLLVLKDGKYIIYPSTSPENNYIDGDGNKCSLDYSTGMSQEIVYDVFDITAKAQKLLNLKDTFSEYLPLIKMPHIQKNGELCEWHSDHEPFELHHRHVSHLYGLYPAKLFNEELKQGAKQVLLSRGDDGTGWSLAWKINLWANLGDGEHALTLLNNQLRLVSKRYESAPGIGGTYVNMLCAHPPFQIDGNFGAASGMMEMLVQFDKDGSPTFLPATPKIWSKGEIRGLCIPGNKKLDFTFENGEITSKKVY